MPDLGRADLILPMKAKIDRAYNAVLQGDLLNKQSIIELLSVEAQSPDGLYLRQKAHQASLQLTNKQAFIWGAIGLDYAYCPQNCDFCSFGAAWGLIKEEKIYSLQEIIAQVKEYAACGVHFIVLRTTQYYPLDILRQCVRTIREEVPGSYEIVANVGEFNLDMANELYLSGVDGIYHAIRLREGRDTRFQVEDRLKTLEAIRQSPLHLIHLVEPVGPEHTYEEIADRFLETVRCGAYISGVMARVPVKGTPLGDIPPISEENIAKITAVLRLSGGNVVKNICSHPASELSVQSGANVLVIETGAVPRDNQISHKRWKGFDCKKAKEIFSRNGFKVKA